MSDVWFYLLLLAFSGAGIVFILMGIPPLGLLFLAWPVTWLGLTLVDLTVVQPGLTWVKRLATEYPLASGLALVWGALVGTFLLLAIDEKERSR
jgi:hypothetical protein